MRRFTYYFAASADGFIARPDGSVDWLESRPAGDYGFDEFLAGVDTVVWGRRTWDEAAARGGIEPFGAHTKHHVVTHRPAAPREGVEFVHDVPALVARLRAAPGKDVWIMGGGILAASLIDAGGLDELFVHVIPVLLGEGIPMVATRRGDITLKLVESRAFPDGVLRVRYAAERATDRRPS